MKMLRTRLGLFGARWHLFWAGYHNRNVAYHSRRVIYHINSAECENKLKERDQ